MPGHSWWEVHIPSLDNQYCKQVSNGGLLWWHWGGDRSALVTRGDGQTMRGCDTRTISWHAPMMSSWHVNDQCATLCVPLPIRLPVWRRREYMRAQECHEGRYFSPHVELWESLFPCDILRSRCSEYVTFHVDCTGVHTACTPSVHVYTPSRTIHSVVRRPQRGPHRWSSLRENKWNNEITVLSQLTGLITVKIRNLNVWSWDVTSTRVKWQDRLDSDMCQHLTNIIS